MESDIAAAVDAIARNSGNGSTVIVFVDAGYVDVFRNWLAFAEAVPVENLVAIAVDDESHETCLKSRVPCVRIPSANSLDELWVHRAQLFSLLCEAGIDFIHSDADAIWLRSPVKYIDALGVDIAFSQGTVWPHDAADEWGFVLCCGFFAVQSGPGVTKFLSAVARQTEIDGSDQAAANHVLMSSGIRWHTDGPGDRRLLKSGRFFRIFRTPVFGSCDGLSVVLLPHRHFPRLREVSNEAYVAHPTSRKSGAQKQEVLRQLGLWKVA